MRAMDQGPPLFARVLVACCIAGRSYTPPTLWAHLRACREAGRAEAGDAIGGLRNRPRSVPSGLPLRVDAFAVEGPRDLRDGKFPDCIHFIDAR